MKVHDSNFFRWLFSTPYRSLHRAYETSKKVRNIQRDYLFYKNVVGESSKRSFSNVTLYIENILNQAASNIFWSLIEFKISITFCNFLVSLQPNLFPNLFQVKTQKDFQEEGALQTNKVFVSNQKNNNTSLNLYTKSLKQKFFFKSPLKEKWNNFSIEQKNKKVFNFSSDNFFFTASLQKNSFFIKKFYNKNLDWERWNRKLIWIEAVLIDLEALKNKSWFDYAILNRNNVKLNQNSWTSKLKDTAYESLGLVPRSITRTLSRFQTELAGRSASLVLPEFRLAKYQAITSLKYLAFLIFCPWFILFFCKILFLEPLIENWWNTSQFQIFLSFSQEEKALKRLQQVEELLWLDIIMADSSAKQPQDLSAQIHQRTIDLVETYNEESIQTILHLFTNFIFISVIIFLLIWGKKRLAILNSWVQEVFYSLSDTMKAFFILLFTDLCIGFHSPHGWEIFIGFLLEHLGFSHNKHVISCFVSTFPVILDTVFKYWIFRHLNRISPSIVVSYHTMNE
jgi:hypothetical protein